AKKCNEEATAQALMAEVALLNEEIPALEAQEKQLSRCLDGALAHIPNLPLDEVPDGKDASGNVERHRFGQAQLRLRAVAVAVAEAATSISARRWERWISKPRRSFLARASSF